MASSFSSQISGVMGVLRQIFRNDPSRSRVLDVGKGFGKYGFLIHEFIGISDRVAPDPSKNLREQSRIAMDAVEVQPNYMWPHISQIYERVFMGDVTSIYDGLPTYDVVVMTDVIEHLERDSAVKVMQHFLGSGAILVIASPAKFFEQEAYGSEWEHHRSYWRARDFAFAPWMEWETVADGRIYVLSTRPEKFPVFGSRPYRRLRRVARWSFRQVWMSLR